MLTDPLFLAIMRKSRRCNKILDKILEINEDCSKDTSEENECELGESEPESETTQSVESGWTELSSDSEEENLFTVRRSKKMRIFSSSDSEDERTSFPSTSQNVAGDIEIATDGTQWTKLKPGGSKGRTPIRMIFKDIGGPTAHAKRNIMVGCMLSAFDLIIDKHIMQHIKDCTETEARRVLKTDWTITIAELRSFIGVLYARGAYEARSLKASYLWSKKWGPPFFRNTMSRDKFTEILRFIRFDKKNQRSERLQTDKFALISEVWRKFISNSQACYKPHENISIDEQLFPTKARCRFTQYMPNKPHKFGIKFWLAVDVELKYIVNGFPYLGKDETRSSQSLGEFVTLTLAEPYLDRGRNITTDNFFTSIPLAQKLLARKTTLVGTIRSNKRELPKSVKEKKDKMTLFSSDLYKSENFILTVYKSKPNIKVLLLSTRHTGVQIEDNHKRLPESISYYNKTKFGVDVVDQMARKYSVKAGNFRWPLQIFFNILDLAAINAWILYKQCTGATISRKQYMFSLAEELDAENKENICQRSGASSSSIILQERKSCQVGYCNKNKSSNCCISCKKVVCGKCTGKAEYTCKKCTE